MPVTVKSYRGSVAEPRSGTKIHSILKQLQSKKGANLERICATTGWQAHSVRAALSDLRKRGYPIIRIIRQNGKSTYVIREV